jgi:hypothetical protein
MTFNVHNQMIALAGKQLALILKKIIGVWLVCRFDDSPEISSLATKSFQLAFPNKENQVVSFCQAEIIEYIRYSIQDQTAKTVVDARLCSEDEMEQKYITIISGCLDALGYLICNET